MIGQLLSGSDSHDFVRAAQLKPRRGRFPMIGSALMGLALLMALAWMGIDAVQLYRERRRALKHPATKT